MVVTCCERDGDGMVWGIVGCRMGGKKVERQV